MNDLQDLLRARLREKNWTATRLRTAMREDGVFASENGVRNWLDGTIPSGQFMAPLARALGIPLQDLCDAAEWQAEERS